MSKVALVTGGSKGIGYAAAKAMYDMGYTVIVVARDEERLKACAEGFDPADPFSRAGKGAPFSARPRIGVLRPEDRAFYGDEAAAALYDAAVVRLAALGAEAIPFHFAPFRQAALLLYRGPWVA